MQYVREPSDAQSPSMHSLEAWHGLPSPPRPAPGTHAPPPPAVGMHSYPVGHMLAAGSHGTAQCPDAQRRDEQSTAIVQASPIPPAT